MVDEYDDIILAQRDRFDEILRKSCDSAAKFRCTETTADDWLDTPEIQARMIIEL